MISPHPMISEHREFLLIHFMEWMSAHLSDCSRVFDGDLTEMMALTVIGQIFVRHHAYDAARNYELDGNDLSVSASHISEITSMPRETVRRSFLFIKTEGMG